MISRLRARFAQLWQNVRLLAGVFGLVRFQLIMLALGLVLVLFVGQARDLLIGYGLNFESDPGWHAVWFVATTIGCALTIWYSARVMYRFRFVGRQQRLSTEPRVAPSDQTVFPWLKRHLPRWLGGSVFVILLLGIASLWDSATFTPWQLVITLSVALAAFLVFVNQRRRWFNLPDHELQCQENNLDDFADLPLSTRRWFWGLLLTNVLAMLFAMYAPHAMAAMIGPGAVLLLGASLSVVVGSMLVYLSNWFRFPVVVATLLLIVCFSYLNDNHRIRLCPDMVSTDAPEFCPQTTVQRPTAAQALERWAVQRKDDGPDVPVIIVATEGGGIRAAYWTAAILGELEDRSTAGASFHRYLFGVSSVSGGSLGAAVYASLIHEGGGNVFERSTDVLAGDLLGPTLVTFMFPDLLQRFLPVAVFDDRAMTLEQTFERAWSGSVGSDTFAQPFANLWREPNSPVPMLFFNSTLVETGERMVYSPVRIDGGARINVLDAVDGVAALGGGVALSTAVHNSARFTYLSPAGVVRRRDTSRSDNREHWARVVDGGYFENSGSLTAMELLQLVLDQRAGIAQRHQINLVPYVVQITNSAANPQRNCDRLRRDAVAFEADDVCFKKRVLPEILSPLFALLNARIAHTGLALKQLRESAPADHYRLLALRNNGVAHPLGWMLAEPSRRDMRCQVRGYDGALCEKPIDDPVDISADVTAVLSFIDRTLSSAQTQGTP